MGACTLSRIFYFIHLLKGKYALRANVSLKSEATMDIGYQEQWTVLAQNLLDAKIAKGLRKTPNLLRTQHKCRYWRPPITLSPKAPQRCSANSRENPVLLSTS